MNASNQLTMVETDEALRALVPYLAIGQDPTLDEQLIKKSQQPSIIRYTPKDAEERFGNPTMLQQWRAKGRQVHWLLGIDDDLAGIIWYGSAAFPLDLPLATIPTETFAIRLYDGYSGHGLAAPFMRQSLGLYVRAKQSKAEKITGLWLQTDTDNEAALKVYAKLGCQEVGRDSKRVTLVLSAKQMLKIAAA